MLLEVIVQSVADAVAAASGGADRLEVVRDIVKGGLTPPSMLVRAIAEQVDLPLRVMVRENDGYDLRPGELPGIGAAIETFAALHVDGIVLGFSHAGRLSIEDLHAVLDRRTPIHVTFHRAFDQLAEPLPALDVLRTVPLVDRILTSGGTGDPAARCERLRVYRDRAHPVTIVAGGGVDEATLDAIVRTGCVTEVHVGRLARVGADPDAPVSEDRVRRLAQRLRGREDTRQRPQSR